MFLRCSLEDLKSEGDVEMKLLSPLLLEQNGLAYHPEDVKNKSYMRPTSIDKGAGKRVGYYPDYTVVLNSLPVMVVEAKEPDEAVEKGFKEAQLYAHVLNKQFPSGINPVQFVVASNGRMAMYGSWDCDNATTIEHKDLFPGSAIFETFRGTCNRAKLLEHAKEVRRRLQPGRRYKSMERLGGPFKQDQTLTQNQFAKELAPLFREYFDTSAGRTDEKILDHAYVSSTENTQYGQIIESLLRDNLARHRQPDFQPIETSRRGAPAFDEVMTSAVRHSKTTAPMILLIGGVGSGKSIFVDKYRRSYMSEAVQRRSLWVFVDFNTAPGDLNNLDAWITRTALEDFPARNGLDGFRNYDNLCRYFGREIDELREGRYKKLPEEKFEEKLSEEFTKWEEDREHFLRSVIQHYGGERAMTVVVVFDNADRRDAEQQLKIFQAVQHFRATHKCFTILSLRDETYNRYQDEPPLDAFYKGNLFRVQPARFLDIARERLKLVVEDLTAKAPNKMSYTLAWGAKVEFPASELGEYIHKLYNSLFNQRRRATRLLFESLAGRNMRTALEMFAEIVLSPHFQTEKIFGARFKKSSEELEDWMILRTLMRKNRMYYKQEDESYICNLFDIDPNSTTTSIFLLASLLEILSRDRKLKGELNIEGYRHVEKLIEEVTIQGYLAEDALWGLEVLLKRKLITADHQRSEGIERSNYVKISASGHYHYNRLMFDSEYMNGVAMDVWLRDEPHADRLKELGDLNDDKRDLNFQRIYQKLRVFHEAIHGEAKLHSAQTTIEQPNNDVLNHVLKGIDKSIKWTP